MDSGGPVQAGNGTLYKLPNGQYISNFDGWISGSETAQVMQANVTADPSRTIHFRDSQTLLAAFSIIRAQERYINNDSTWENLSPSAIECALTLCLKAYNSSVSNALFAEEILAVSSIKLPESYLVPETITSGPGFTISNRSALGTLDWNPIFHNYYVPRTDFRLDSSGFNQTWNPLYTNFSITQKFIDSTLNMLISLCEAGGSVYNGGRYDTAILGPLYLSPNLSDTFQVTAKSLTNAMRNASPTPALGHAQQWVVKFQIRWESMTLPIAVVLGKSSRQSTRQLITHEANYFSQVGLLSCSYP